jgi:hypothetical protein
MKIKAGITCIAKKLHCSQAGQSMRKRPEPKRMQQQRNKRLSRIAFFMSGKV